MMSLGEKSRAAEIEGYNAAVDRLIPQLQTELDNFRERIKNDANFKVENKAGLEFDRRALLAGEIWRLWSGHLVHYSWQQSLVDGAVALVAGLIAVRAYGVRRLLAAAWRLKPA